MPNIANRIAENGRRWVAMRFDTGRIGEFDAVSRSLVGHKAQYQEISAEIFTQKAVRVPYGVIGVVDQREHAMSLGLVNSYLGNGQRLDQVTTIAPVGRGPFLHHATDTPLHGPFSRGALDALIDVQHVDEWARLHGGSVASWLTFLESLNGFGYANGPKGNPPMSSPYIWGGTSEQERGKYISDGVFDHNVMDPQLGCAGMLRYMSGLDPSIGFGPPDTVPIPVPTPTPTPVPVPVPVPVPLPTPGPIAMPDFAELSKQLSILLQIISAAQSGNVAAIPKLVASELYRIALAIDPTLKGTA